MNLKIATPKTNAEQALLDAHRERLGISGSQGDTLSEEMLKRSKIKGGARAVQTVLQGGEVGLATS